MFNDRIIQNFIKAISEYRTLYGVNATRYEFDNKIIEMNNPYLSYIFKIRIGSDRKEHDIIVSKSNDPELIYNYAVKIKEADVLLLEDALINLRGKIIEETYIKYLILYLKDVPNCDIEKISREINSLKKERKIK